jgi:uncharacterized membrane protein
MKGWEEPGILDFLTSRAPFRLPLFSLLALFAILPGPMDWLEFFDLVVPGFAACAEFGFFLFVRPNIRRLPDRQSIEAEQGFLRTFNRAMPILTGLSVVLILIYAFRFKENDIANQTVWGAVFCFSAAGASGIWLNHPLAQEIAGWNPEQLPADWKSVRTRWAIAQGLRASLQMLGFILFCVSLAAR